jgi:hypothetical protein
MKHLPYDPWSSGLVPQSDLIGPNTIAKKRCAERRERKQHAIDQLFKGDCATEVMPPVERTQGVYRRCDVQRTSHGHYFTTLRPIPAELVQYVSF